LASRWSRLPTRTSYTLLEGITQASRARRSLPPKMFSQRYAPGESA